MAVKIYLLDTNILSEPTKASPNEHALTNLEAKSAFSVIAAPVWYELLKGLGDLPDGHKKSELQTYTHEFIAEAFPVLPFDRNAAGIQAEIFARLKKSGTPAPFIDTQIASIAISNNLILVTRNIKDFKPIQRVFPFGLENWFDVDRA